MSVEVKFVSDNFKEILVNVEKFLVEFAEFKVSGQVSKNEIAVTNDQPVFIGAPPFAEPRNESNDFSHIDVSALKKETEASKPEAKKRGRPKSAAKELISKEPDEVVDFGDTVATPTPPITPKVFTLEQDIIPGFQAFAKAKSREEAGKVIASYGVKSVRDLPQEKYEEILQRISV